MTNVLPDSEWKTNSEVVDFSHKTKLNKTWLSSSSPFWMKYVAQFPENKTELYVWPGRSLSASVSGCWISTWDFLAVLGQPVMCWAINRRASGPSPCSACFHLLAFRNRWQSSCICCSMISAGASEHFKVYPNPLTAEKDLKVHPVSLRRYLKDIQLQHLHQAQVRRASPPCKTLMFSPKSFSLFPLK